MADETIVLNQTYLEQQIKNVLVFSNVPDDPDFRQEIADNIRQDYGQFISMGSKHESWSLDSLTFVYNGSAPIFSVEVDFTAGPLQGTATDNPLPPQVALLVSLQKNGIPPNRGRVYLAGYTEVQNNGSGDVLSSTLVEAENLFEEWAGGIPFNSGGDAIFLRIGRRNESGIITASSQVEVVVPRSTWATQRRRRKGVGI